MDETLPGLRGTCGSRKCVPSKPSKYSIKSGATEDAKVFYTGNVEVYAGRQPEGPHAVGNKPADVAGDGQTPRSAGRS